MGTDPLEPVAGGDGIKTMPGGLSGDMRRDDFTHE